MKKQTKIKLNRFWNKIKKPLMILSFVGNILFLLFIIVGCVGSKKQAQQTNADSGIITLRYTKWLLNENFNSTPSGKSFDSEDSSSTSGYLESYIVRYKVKGDNTDYSNLNFQKSNSLPNKYTFNGGYTNDNYEQVDRQFAYKMYLPTLTWDNSDYRYIEFGDTYYNTHDYDNPILINWLFENAVLLEQPEYSTFNFLAQFNYNGPLGGSADSMFVNSLGEQSKHLTIDLPTFWSNGSEYNQISVWYLNGGSMGYIDPQTNTTATNTNTQTLYYLELEYINTYTGLSTPVNFRNFRVSSGSYLAGGSTWRSSEFRYLKFSRALTPDERTSIECFNNDYYSGSGEVTSDVGISNVFTLLGSAFMSLRNLFSIQILPNISLGLLIFMPLVVGIILTIIWVVKR